MSYFIIDIWLAHSFPCAVLMCQSLGYLEAVLAQVVRMGSGKGSPEYWVAVVKPGRVMFEIAGVPEETAREAMRLASHKLPLKCKFVKREDTTGGDENEG